MSRAARRIRRNRDREMRRYAIKVGAAVRGCVCKPTIEHRGAHVITRHDSWCAAADTGPQLLLARGRHQSPEDFARAVVNVLRELQA